MTFLKKLFRLLSRREKKIAILLLVVSIFVSLLETFSISLIMLFATVATNFSNINSNKYYQFLYHSLGCTHQYQFVIIMGFFLIVFYFFRGGIITSFTYFQSRFAQSRFKNFAFRFFQNYLNFKYIDFTSSHPAKLGRVITGDASQVTTIIAAIMMICSEALTILFIYFSLLYVNWKMTLVLTILLSVKVFFIIKAFSGKLESLGKRSRTLNIKLGKIFGESFRNFKLIKLFSNEKPILKKFESASWGVVKANILNAVLQNSPRIILETLGFSILISLIMYVVYTYNDATHVIPIITMYAFAFYRFLPSINRMLMSYNQIRFNKNAIDGIQEFLVYDLEDLGYEQIPFKKKITLKNVSFSYDDKNRILSNVNLEIKKGERTAFIGESGAGKSTIADVIMGLYKPQEGAIFIDGNKLDRRNLRAWRTKIGYIPQQVYLFDGTVAENIVFGREYDEKKIIEVLKKANIYDFLVIHEGIYSKTGEGGVKLSGGQVQRIAIARALYSDPQLLVLDEATSALDNETESKIMDEIYSLEKDKTLIIIAHRLSTVERCETIYRIDNEKVSLVEDLYALYNKKDFAQVEQKQV